MIIEETMELVIDEYHEKSKALEDSGLLKNVTGKLSKGRRTNIEELYMDVAFADDQMRARTGHAAHNLAVLKHITLNLIRLDPIPRKGGIKVRRLIAATSDEYREQLFGLRPV